MPGAARDGATLPTTPRQAAARCWVSGRELPARAGRLMTKFQFGELPSPAEPNRRRNFLKAAGSRASQPPPAWPPDIHESIL